MRVLIWLFFGVVVYSGWVMNFLFLCLCISSCVRLLVRFGFLV